MKRPRNIFLISLFICTCLNAQVGINTRNPIVSLQVDRTSGLLPDGFLAPRLTGDELKQRDDLYTADFDGVFVYVTKPVTVASPKTVQLTEEGYYYYNSQLSYWIRMNARINSVKDKIFAIINARSGTVGRNTKVLWDLTKIEGINTDKLQVNGAGNITFPPNRSFKITAMIGVGFRGEVKLPTYIVTRFRKSDGSSLPISTWGYTESSTEAFDDGGVTNAICVFDSGMTGLTLYLEANNPPDNRVTLINGAPSNMSLGSYLIIEEL